MFRTSDVLRLTFLLLTVCLASCNRAGSELRFALRQSGENRPELERVLNHYRESGDEERLAAAEFLIGNMAYHKSYEGDMEAYRSCLDSLYPQMNSAGKYNELMSGVSRLFNKEKNEVYDIEKVSSEYLIDNIEEAFYLWKEGRWARHLDFGKFCEYILPYKVDELQPLEEWREEYCRLFHSDEDLIDDAIDEYRAEPAIALQNIRWSAIGNVLEYNDSIAFTELFDLRELKNVPYGDCMSLCNLGLLLYRSRGIPVAVDFVPQWSDRSGSHSWLSVFTRRCTDMPMNAFSTGNPEDEVQCRRIPKVYRRTFKADRELVKRINKGYALAPSINDVFIEDVTDEYIKCENVTVKASKRNCGDNIYAAVFNNRGWIPVACGQKKGIGSVRFEKLGRNSLYLPVSIDKSGRQIPVGNPFFINADGRVDSFRTAGTGTPAIDFSSSRKYPVYWRLAAIFSRTRGGIIQGCNTADFMNADTIAVVHEKESWSGFARVCNPKQYRYYRFCAEEDESCDIAELKFYQDDSILSPVRCFCPTRAISVPDRENVTVDDVFDDNALTWFPVSDSIKTWVGADFGRSVSVNGVYYSFRGDGNDFYPGYEYVLRFWDGQDWAELQYFTGEKEVSHTFSGVLEGVLLLVSCNSKGTQSRPFTVKDGQVIWY